jgi:hypothetical protein
VAVVLDRTIRKILETTITGKDGARELAERGARNALIEIGLEDARRPEGLSQAQIELRNRLRAHARSLGDVMAADGSIKANRLVREIAYEHWHRALFARFLAENNLLIDPDHKVAVSLSELEQIAKEEGRDLIDLAADWGEPMLPQIFRKDDPVLALALPPETKAGITEIVKFLPRAVFVADDSLGWVYQFWQADQKDRVNESGVKIGADELPAVTQLFTEDYMVLFLLENTLGAWWTGKALVADLALAAGAESEEELRERTSPPGYRWTYLRFVREPRDGETLETATGPWRPAAGTFEAWPKAAKGITVLDPCMGSGHFLVFVLPILIAFRRNEEGLDERAAVKAVLAQNLFGLEIDPRCTQIAAFALALASWKRLGGPEPLPRLNLACSGLTIGLGKAEFLKLAERIAADRGWRPSIDLLGDGATPIESAAIKREREGLSRLYDLFEKAPYLGSLIDPRRAGDDIFAAGYDRVADVLGDVFRTNEAPEIQEMAVAAQGLARAAELLSHPCTLIVTNVPFLGRSRAASIIVKYCDAHHKAARHDLAVVFWSRFLLDTCQADSIGLVVPSSVLSLASYREFRARVLSSNSIEVIARLGAGAFETVSGAVVNVTLAIAKHGHSKTISWIDAQDEAELASKQTILAEGKIITAPVQLTGKTNILTPRSAKPSDLLGGHIDVFEGTSRGDAEKYDRQFWELASIESSWSPLLNSPQNSAPFSGRELVFKWDGGGGELAKSKEARIRGRKLWGVPSVVVARTSDLKSTLSVGEIYAQNLISIAPRSQLTREALFCFTQSAEFRREVRKLNQKPLVPSAIVKSIFIDCLHWRRVANEIYPTGLPKPYSNDPTQWLFDGHPRGSADPNVARESAVNQRLLTPHGVRPRIAEYPLQVAVARLLGYRWPRQTGSAFTDCPALSDPDELDQSGLVDADGIVPLPALVGEADAASRLRELIRVVWGGDYSEGTIRDLLAVEGASATDVETWLANEFFDSHCQLFHQTPFIWQVWDGARGGFSALVNYHRLCETNGAGRRLLEKLRDSYLGEWIAAQRRALTAGEAGAEERLIAAEHLRGELTKIIEGQPPYDIFVRWKPLYRQPIGWEPDIDDGVRLNIRPFLTAKPRKPGRQDACILRVTPRVKKHAGADRGAEPHREKEDFPWFWAEDSDVEKEDFAGGPAFKGRRYNDFHYTRAFKQRARDAKAKAVRGVA